MEDAARSNSKEPASASRYERLVKIASGGMASVYVGRLRGALGFQQLVAIKRPHAHLLHGSDLKRALLAEARLASRIRHANVVSVRDVETEEDSVLLVMDYVEGASMHELLHGSRTADRRTAIRAGLRVVRDLCAGLQAVHDLTDDDDRPLGLVHRDVSPQNVLVGVDDGVARLADFGIAKCLHAHDTSTAEGTLKGKFAYMAPEYILGAGFDQRADLFAVGVLLWEILTNRRLFDGESHIDIIRKVLGDRIPPVSELSPELGRGFDALVDCALTRDPVGRFAHARDLGAALEAALAQSDYAATHEEVARFVRAQVGPRLADRKRRIKEGMGIGLSARPPAVQAVTASVVIVERADAPRPPEALGEERFASAVSAPDSAAMMQELRPRRRRTMIALMSSVVGLTVGLGAIAGFGALAARGKHPLPDELPSAAPVDETPATPASAVVPPRPESTIGPVLKLEPVGVDASAAQPTPIPRAPSSSSNEPSTKGADKVEKNTSKPKKVPPPPVSASAPGTETPRPRGNPY